MISCAARYGGKTEAASDNMASSDIASDEEIVNAITRLREFSFLSVQTSDNRSSGVRNA